MTKASGSMTKEDGMMAMGTAKPGTLHGTAGHAARGTIHILDKGGKRLIHFTPDFKAEAGSDTYVVLSRGTKPGSGSARLAKLEHPAGEQMVAVPAGVDLHHYSHLLLWSKDRNLVVATADLPVAATGEGAKMGNKMGAEMGSKMGEKMGTDSSTSRSH